MLSYTQLRVGMFIEWEGNAYQVLEADFLRMQQRKPVMKTKLRDIVSGKVKDHSFQPSDDLEEADLSRRQVRFIYENKGEYWFDDPKNPKNRFSLSADQMGDKGKFLIPQTEVVALEYKSVVINIDLPIKIDLEVVEAPPAIKGDTASGGSKQVMVQTGAKVSTPFFIAQGDIIRINTETGEYVERVEKA